MSRHPAPSQRAVRKQIRLARARLDPRFRADASLRVARYMARSLRFIQSRRVAFYMATGGELDLWPLMQAANAAGKICCLPVMTDRLMRFEKTPLWFQHWHPGNEPLVESRFGTLEPPLSPQARVPVERLDILFVPLVAFDRRGQRIGMGKGYYDRTLAQIGRRFRRPWLVGCGYQMQEVESIPANPWDIPLDAILTETGLSGCLQPDGLRCDVDGNAKAQDDEKY